MSRVVRKLVFGVLDQVRFKATVAGTYASQRPGTLDIETGDSVLSRQRTTKALIRLRERAG